MSDEIVEVTELELSDYFGVSDRRIRQMSKEGIAVKVGRGTYDLKRSVKNYINSLKKGGSEDPMGKLKLAREAESLTHERLKKRKTELQVLEIEKHLLRTDDVESIWNTMIFAAKSKITTIPTKVAPVLVGIEDAKEIQSILKREIGESLNEISNFNIEDFDSHFEDDLDGEEE